MTLARLGDGFVRCCDAASRLAISAAWVERLGRFTCPRCRIIAVPRITDRNIRGRREEKYNGMYKLETTHKLSMVGKDPAMLRYCRPVRSTQVLQ